MSINVYIVVFIWLTLNLGKKILISGLTRFIVNHKRHKENKRSKLASI